MTGSIVDSALLERLMAEFEVDLIFHLAALLSTRSEFTPVAAHQVNVEGTLQPARVRAARSGIPRPAGRVHLSLVDRRVWPAGPRRRSRALAGSREDEYLHPTTMYGCNKLYCELLGDLLRAPLQAAGRGADERPGGFPVRALPGPDLGADRCRQAARRTTRPR